MAVGKVGMADRVGMVAGMVGRVADRVGRADKVGRVAGGSCCSCCFRKAGKGMEEADSHISRL